MTYFDGQKVLMVMAHPDDEVIFGWPILQNKSVEKCILLCSSDLNNPARVWCSYRKTAFAKLCDNLGISWDCLDYNSEFYRLKTRDLPKPQNPFRFFSLFSQLKLRGKSSPNDGDDYLSKMIDDVLGRIQRFSFDLIYTHNPWGEYGHLDHQLVHSIVASVGASVVISDMFVSSNWVPFRQRPPVFERVYCTKNIEHCENDLEFYEWCSEFYSNSGVWTWSNPPILTCRLFQV